MSSGILEGNFPEPLGPGPARADSLSGFPVSPLEKLPSEIIVSSKEPALPDNKTLQQENQRLQRELQLYNQIRRALLYKPEHYRIFPVFAEIISKAFENSLISIFLLEGELPVLRARSGFGQEFDIFPTTIKLHEQVTSSGKPGLVVEINKEPNEPEGPALTSSKICVPLIGRGNEVLGTLGIESFSAPVLNEQDLALSENLAEHIVLAFEQSRLLTNERNRTRQFALLNQIGRDLTASLDVDTIIQRVGRSVRLKLGYYSVNIGLVEGEDIVYRLSLPDPFQPTGTSRIPLDKTSLSSYCVKSGEMLVIRNVLEDPRYLHNELLPDVLSEVLLPLRSAGEIIGVLDIESDRLDAFEDDDIILLKTLADETSVALEKARQFQEVQKQTQNLNAANQKLIEANRLKSEFLANISHELRTPMNSIMGYVDMMLSDYYGEIPEALKTPLDRINLNSTRLLTLINSVLDFANLEAGRLTIIPEPILLEDVLNKISNNYSKQARVKGFDFEVVVQPETPKIFHCDPKRFIQLLDILLSNAFKFTSKGKVELEVRPVPGDPFRVEFQVKDTGIGIKESDYEHIFEEFRQVDGSSTRLYGGSGLGLALARKASQLMGGTIRVTSQPGLGSIFTLILPVKMPAV